MARPFVKLGGGRIDGGLGPSSSPPIRTTPPPSPSTPLNPGAPRAPWTASPQQGGQLVPSPARGGSVPFAEPPPQGSFNAGPRPAPALPPPKTDWLPSSQALRDAATPKQLRPSYEPPLNIPKGSPSGFPKPPLRMPKLQLPRLGVPKGLGGQIKGGLGGLGASLAADALLERLLGPKDPFGNYLPDFVRDKVSERQNSPLPDSPFGQSGQRLIVTVTWGDGFVGTWGEIDAPVYEFFALQFQPDSHPWTFIYSNAQVTRARSVNQGQNREGSPSFSFAVKQPDGSGVPIDQGAPSIEPLPWDSTPFEPFPTPDPFVFPDDFQPALQPASVPEPQPFPVPQAIPFPFPGGLPSPAGFPFPFPTVPPWAEPNPSPSPFPDRSPDASPSPRSGSAPRSRSGSAPSGKSLPSGQPQPRIDAQTGVLPQSPTPPAQPPTPDRCQDPCIQRIQDTLDSANADQAGVLDLLHDLLLQALQQLQPVPQIPLDLAGIHDALSQLLDEVAGTESITMQFEDCEGTVQAIPVSGGRLRVLARLFQVLNQFDLRAQKVACSTQKISDRIYRILGGDNWFPDQNARLPEFNSAALAAIESWGEQQKMGTKDEGGEVKLLNIIDLIAAYSAVPYYRAGLQQFPAFVPPSLLSYTDNEEPLTIRDSSSYLRWFIQQFDTLVGQFPIEIEFEDADPATKGNQTKKVELCNLSEALAELFGTSFKTSINSDLAINFLMRLASEVIATKNATLIGQEYSRANAAFLGYRGNAAIREVNYSFNPGNLDSLDEFLQESKGQYTGWAEDDPESVVGYLQKIVFSAGIIKAAFFKSPRDITKLQRELENLTEGDEQKSDADWLKLLALLNDQGSLFNRNAPKPNIDNQQGQS